jgi:WD40 repeat protein
MRVYLRLFIVVLALLSCSSASAQEPKGWLGADMQDITKAEADKLGWDTPHGAKVGLVAPGSPADKAGLKTGDIILAIDRSIVDASSDVDSAVAAKRPGAEIRVQVLSGARERRVAVTLAERPKVQEADASAMPHLMLDTGGHMGTIKSVAFTPDGKRLISAGDDKVIRVWDWQTGKTVRTIRGQVGPGDEGKIYTMALSPNGRWLAVGGYIKDNVIRIFDFDTGKLVALLCAHTDVVDALAFSSDSTQLVSGGGDFLAIIWDVDRRKVLHRLEGHREDIYAVAFTPDGTRVVTGSDDTTLRLWRVSDGGLIAGKGTKSVSSARSPSDRRTA